MRINDIGACLVYMDNNNGVYDLHPDEFAMLMVQWESFLKGESSIKLAKCKDLYGCDIIIRIDLIEAVSLVTAEAHRQWKAECKEEESKKKYGDDDV